VKKLKRKAKRLVRSWIYERNESYWFRRDLSNPIPDLETSLPVEISLNNASETIAWLKTFAEPWMYHEKEIRIGLTEGHYFANAKHNGEIIGYSKVGLNKVYVDDYQVIVDLPERVALLYHIYVLKEYRKHNVAKMLLAKLLRELKERKFASMWCQIAIWNKPSVALFSGLGFKKIAHAKFYKLFGVLRFWLIKREDEKHFTLTTRFSALAS
jgi:ribosomal protein S18 acetylase RimI-like enzyme